MNRACSLSMKHLCRPALKHLRSSLTLAGFLLLFPLSIAVSAEFVTPRAFGPVISRNDLLAQYEYYIDKAGAVQTYVALFDGKNSLRLSPESAESIARQTAQAIAADETAKTFPYDRGTGEYRVADGQRSLTVTPTGGAGPVTFTNADVDTFVKNFAEARAVSTTWVGDALKVAAHGRPGQEGTEEPGGDEGSIKRLEDILPESVTRYIPASVTEYGDKAVAAAADLYAKNQAMTVASAVLGLLCLLLFFRGRKHKRNAYRMHEFGQEQLRRLDLQRQDELAAMSSQMHEMSRQLRDTERGTEEQAELLRRESTENAVIFADTVAELVRMRERPPETMDGIIGALLKKYGGTEPGQVLEQARERSRTLAKNHLAAKCSEGTERYGRAACSFITDMFNMKADQAVAMTVNGKAEEGKRFLEEAAKELNSYGRALFHAEITDEYLSARLDELDALYAAKGQGGTAVRNISERF